MEFIFGFLLFALAVYISFYLPGKLMLSLLFPSLPKAETTFISFLVGIGIFLFGVYVSSWLHMPYLYLFVLLGITVYVSLKEKNMHSFSMEKVDQWSWVLILFGSLVFFSLTAFSYITTKNGIQFIGSINVIDGLLHIAYMKNLLTTFPPTHAGLAQIPLRGYHYFYDLLLSRFVLFFHFLPEDLYYRYFSLFIAFLYGGSFYFFASLITKNFLARRWVIFFAYFSQSFAFVLSFFIPTILPTAELGSIYPLELILNPAIILSIAMMLSYLVLLFTNKSKILPMLFIGFLFGIIVELKVYTGIVGGITFAIILLYRVIFKQQKINSAILGLVVAISTVAITYIPNNLGAASFWFSPFFAYSVYMQEPPFTSWNWELQRIIFRDHHNIMHLIILYAQAIGIFWFLTLGSRVIIILGLPKLFNKAFYQQEKNIALLVMIGVPILVGSIFVQSVSIFDTKQFFWIAGVLIAIPAGMVMGNLLQKRLLVGIAVSFVVIVLSWSGVVGQVRAFVWPESTYIIAKNDVSLLQQAGLIMPASSFILVLGKKEDPFVRAPMIAALIGRSSYYEEESAQFALQDVYTKRQDAIAYLQKLLARKCNSKVIRHMLNVIGTMYIVSMQPQKCLTNIATDKLNSNSGLSFYLVP